MELLLVDIGLFRGGVGECMTKKVGFGIYNVALINGQLLTRMDVYSDIVGFLVSALLLFFVHRAILAAFLKIIASAEDLTDYGEKGNRRDMKTSL